MDREPTYQPGDVIETRDSRRLLVLEVGQEAYFLRRLDAKEGELEPVETAWEIAGCEDATWLAGERQADESRARVGPRCRVCENHIRGGRVAQCVSGPRGP